MKTVGKVFKKEKFDFEMLCGEGDISYVYTEAVCNHVLSYHGNVERIYVNGKENEIYAAVKSKQNQTQTGSIAVKAGDRILFRCCRGRDSWMLALDTHNLKLSFLNSDSNTTGKACAKNYPYLHSCEIASKTTETHKIRYRFYRYAKRTVIRPRNHRCSKRREKDKSKDL